MPHCPVARHVRTAFAEHCVAPGAQTPVQAPLAHAWFVQAAAAPHVPSARHVCTPSPEHCIDPGEHKPTHAPRTHAWFVHAATLLQLPSAAQVWTPFPEHCFIPGEQAPAHTPFAHVSLHPIGAAHVALSLHVWTALPEHCVAPGVQTPEHCPLVQRKAHGAPTVCQRAIELHVRGCKPSHSIEPGMQGPPPSSPCIVASSGLPLAPPSLPDATVNALPVQPLHAATIMAARINRSTATSVAFGACTSAQTTMVARRWHAPPRGSARQHDGREHTASPGATPFAVAFRFARQLCPARRARQRTERLRCTLPARGCDRLAQVSHVFFIVSLGIESARLVELGLAFGPLRCAAGNRRLFS